jgi:outer membrane receptor protein involved in Fe transport
MRVQAAGIARPRRDSARAIIALISAVTVSALLGPVGVAAGVTAADIQEVVVTGRRIPLGGSPRAASEGTVLAEQLENRPLLRVGELLEVVPGLIVTQHTGDGKANQYFLRGFNLDHGTDFLTRVDGVPVNLPTHGHGQGYLDMNFVIPELIDRIVYRKGTYYPEYGNFSAAGAADLTHKTAAKPFLAYTGGENGYSRAVAGGSMAALGGSLLAGVEADRTDGPWLLPENLRKSNALLKWSHHSDESYLDITASSYSSEWRASDQVPLRAIEQGVIDRLGFIDPTNGGESHRHSFSIRGDHDLKLGLLRFNAYAVDYGLQLFSNFTYALNQEQGDQFEQYDSRLVRGAALSWERDFVGLGRVLRWRTGVDLREDVISPVGLHLTQARTRYQTIREDRVNQRMSSLWSAVDFMLGAYGRMELGARADRFDYRVRSSLVANSGTGGDMIVSPKASLVFGPWHDTEIVLSAGRGFHSNDARGATITVDPADGVTPVEPVTALAAARGMEWGLRTAILPRTQMALSLWRLDLDSELLFIGDGGTTEATRPSRRQGVEIGMFSKPVDWMMVDADFAISSARFRDRDAIGDRIPGAVRSAASLGIAMNLPSGWFGGLRVRRLGSAPLNEDGSVRSPSSTLLNAEIGRRVGENWRVAVGIDNLLDKEATDLTYFYESQLPGEAAPVEDLHFHPAEPRTVRVTVQFNIDSAVAEGASHRH